MTGSITSPIGKIFQPLLDAVASVLAFFYSLIPNYPVDVALLTIVIMALLTPLTVKSTKNMAAMQALGPEMKKLQQKYKGAENRAQLNEEMMKLYKEHKVNPASGCLPMLLQMPAFFILYSVIRGITNTTTIPAHTVDGLKVAETVVAIPRYIPHDTAMYRNIREHHGQLISFGMDFSDKLLSHHSSIFVAIPYLLLVIGAVGLQYLQMSRLNKRNAGAQVNPQAAMLQKYMPLIFGFIYLNVAAILNVYFIISSGIRILTQEILFRKGMVGGPPPAPSAADKEPGPKAPVADRTERAIPRPKSSGATAAGAGKNGSATNGSNGKARRPATKAATEATAVEKAATSNGRKSPNGSAPPGKRPPPSKATGASKGGSASSRPGTRPRPSGGNSSNGSNGTSTNGAGAASKDHPRSKAKRERKAR
jgi:YidC/Oxa1 family membrane protein insertase